MAKAMRIIMLLLLQLPRYLILMAGNILKIWQATSTRMVFLFMLKRN